LFGRLGGEEFAVIMPETNIENSIVVAERIRNQIESMEIETPLGSLKFTISIGISGLNVDDVLKIADGLLYVAKQHGRNRIITDEL
jgi:diguanylate cyclase (GGDEF)-like protein